MLLPVKTAYFNSPDTKISPGAPAAAVIMTASTASAWIAVAAFAERLVTQLSTLSKADEVRMAFGLNDKRNELQGKAMMGPAEWEALVLKNQVGPLPVTCFDVWSAIGSLT